MNEYTLTLGCLVMCIIGGWLLAEAANWRDRRADRHVNRKQ